MITGRMNEATVIRSLYTGQRVRVKKWLKNDRFESVEGYFIPDGTHVLITLAGLPNQPVADRDEWVTE